MVDPAIPSKIVCPPRLQCRGTEGLLKESHHRSSRSTRPSRPRSPILLGCGAEGPLKESHHRSSRLTQPSRPRSSVLLGRKPPHLLKCIKIACYFRKLKIYTVAFIKIYLFRLTQIIYIKYHNNCQICLLNS